MTLLNKDTFLKGALILTVAGIVVKLIGAPQRIFLSRLLGGDGIGSIQMAYPIYHTGSEYFFSGYSCGHLDYCCRENSPERLSWCQPSVSYFTWLF